MVHQGTGHKAKNNGDQNVHQRRRHPVETPFAPLGPQGLHHHILDLGNFLNDGLEDIPGLDGIFGELVHGLKKACAFTRALGGCHCRASRFRLHISICRCFSVRSHGTGLGLGRALSGKQPGYSLCLYPWGQTTQTQKECKHT
jgi:hypothetical protein